jgi:alginate O-acetyltransferase complex protein AlgI
MISVQFLLMFIASLLLYYLIPKKTQWVFLLLLSVAFYFYSATPYTFTYLAAAVVITYLCGLAIGKQHKMAADAEKRLDEKGKTKALRLARAAYVLALIANIGMLSAMKYLDFFTVNIERIYNLFFMHLPYHFSTLIAALGVSYYTLQIVSYLTDVYWQTIQPERNVLKLALFTSFFPQISSGPIARYPQMREEFFSPHTFQYDHVVAGFQRILWGVLKKKVIGDNLGIITTAIFGDIKTYPGEYIWLATALYIIQIYADFSGYVDIALGGAQCYGIKLPENFSTPFFSRSIQDFWQRWHITLGAWLKDYIMYPILRSAPWNRMGKSLKKHGHRKMGRKVPMFLGMLIHWFFMGLWHGGGWNFIAEGIWFWLVIVLGQLLDPLFQKLIKWMKINTKCFSWHLFQSLRTTVIYAVGALFFRAGTLSRAFELFNSAFTQSVKYIAFQPFAPFVNANLTNDVTLTVVMLCCVLFMIVSTMQWKGVDIWSWFGEQNLVFRWLIMLSLILVIVIFGAYGPGYSASEFVYAGF